MPDPHEPQSRDTELVASVLAGHEDAWREIVRRHRDRLVGLVRSKGARFDLAEDVVHDALMKARRKLAGIRDPAALAGWLSRIAENSLADARRKEKRNARLAEGLAAAGTGDARLEPELPQDRPPVRVMLETVLEAARELGYPPRKRVLLAADFAGEVDIDVLSLAWDEESGERAIAEAVASASGPTQKQIAAALGIDRSLVSREVNAARRGIVPHLPESWSYEL